MVDVEERPKVVEDSQLTLKMHPPVIFFVGPHRDVKIFLIRELLLSRSASLLGENQAAIRRDGLASRHTRSTISRGEVLKPNVALTRPQNRNCSLYPDVLLGEDPRT